MSTHSASPSPTHSWRPPDEDTAARIALAAAGVSGDPTVAIGITRFGGAAKFLAAVHDQQDSLAPLSALVRQRIRVLATAPRVARILPDTAAGGLGIITPSCEEWPVQLSALRGAAPLVLWVRADMGALTFPSVAITGTGSPTAWGIHMTIEFATGLASRGWAIVAGTGPGVDRLALSSAAAMRAPSVTVSPGSMTLGENPSGLSVQLTEVPPGAPLTVRSQRRARYLVAAIAAKTIVVEAGASSGAIRAAQAAHALDRPVGVVVHEGRPLSAGCQELATRHVVARLAIIRDADWFH